MIRKGLIKTKQPINQPTEMNYKICNQSKIFIISAVQFYFKEKFLVKHTEGISSNQLFFITFIIIATFNNGWWRKFCSLFVNVFLKLFLSYFVSLCLYCLF